MRVLISGPGRSDLKDAFDFLHADNPRAAAATLDILLEAIRSLIDLPDRGRPGRIPGTREFVVTRTGHVIAYLVRDDEVVVLRVRHGRQAWPR
jgi:plasmid stabilization system protein ParE